MSKERSQRTMKKWGALRKQHLMGERVDNKPHSDDAFREALRRYNNKKVYNPGNPGG